MKRTGRRSIKRTLFRLALYILAGAIINVTVAWGCGYLGIFHTQTSLTSESIKAELRTALEKELNFVDGVEVHGRVLTAYGHEQRSLGGMVDVDGIVTFVRIQQVDSGWPLVSLRGWTMQWGAKIRESTGLIETTRPIFGRSIRVGLPINPHWPGFAINTIIYAAILWMLFAAPGFVRRRIRIVRHRCPACGYLIGTSPVCTECGTPLSPSR